MQHNREQQRKRNPSQSSRSEQKKQSNLLQGQRIDEERERKRHQQSPTVTRGPNHQTTDENPPVIANVANDNDDLAAELRQIEEQAQLLEERKRLLMRNAAGKKRSSSGERTQKTTEKEHKLRQLTVELERDKKQREQREAQNQEIEYQKREELKRKRMALLWKEMGAKAPPPEQPKSPAPVNPRIRENASHSTGPASVSTAKRSRDAFQRGQRSSPVRTTPPLLGLDLSLTVPFHRRKASLVQWVKVILAREGLLARIPLPLKAHFRSISDGVIHRAHLYAQFAILIVHLFSITLLYKEDEGIYDEDEDEDEEPYGDDNSWRRELQELTRALAKGRNYREDDSDFDDAAMEVSWRDALAEDSRRYAHWRNRLSPNSSEFHCSARLGAEEDREDMKEELRRKKEKLRKKKLLSQRKKAKH